MSHLSNETKRDVFEDTVFNIETGSPDGPEFARELIQRYYAALPDNIPVIPKAVGEYLKRYKLMFTLFGCMKDAVSHIDTPLDALNQTKYHWIANNQNTFARAWVLGAWIVEETGEILKLEAEVRDETD